ncbi:uncharacterized protein N7483_012759 [Penicillium malachiteum]|uniref:uncharacterized protein n=1 Tax=Penicillium malachiteum TaxID=1324776 RepID=UPI0025498601|nr:uncharacterized protein N7483_012759 [Penicillium malachiteum]KAJ5715578.1 hypothetical protein N7483_012759 [Penicillium malachiteum]
MTSEEDTYDFIVVGAGPAGYALAASLSRAKSKPRVLLLEAGGKNDDETKRVDGKRWTTFMEPTMNWGYKTVPQEGCSGRVIDYSRGKGLGGGSAINFGVYTVGAKDDYDAWGEKVGDEVTFGWKAMQRRFKALETFDGSIELPEHQKYARPDPADHGHDGPLKIGYAKEWEKDLPLILDSLEESGLQRNLDHNSGNPLGMALMINSASGGRRTTASLFEQRQDSDWPIPNWMIIHAPVTRTIFHNKKVIGVETRSQSGSDPKIYYATKEVILSAGTLDTPKILMHSGIGPREDLEKYGIRVVQDLPAVGQGMKDHFNVPLVLRRNPETNDRNSFYGSEEAMSAALTQWNEDKTGPWTKYGCQIVCGWFKSDKIKTLPEFKDLDASVQDFMNRETIPQYQIISGFPMHIMLPELFQDHSYICLLGFLMNQQSSGEVRLQSSNLEDPLLFDPKALTHPYDQRAAIEIYRHLLEIAKHPAFAKDTVSTIHSSPSESDEDILQYWKDNTTSSWHMTGTVKMGKEGDVDAAVDNRFRVFGVEGLRVADMSVVPVMTNNHTQATAYVTGATCAEVLIREYALDEE